MDAAALNYRGLVVEIAGPVRLGENIKAVLARVAKASGLSPRRVRSIWNDEIEDLRGREVLALVKAAREAKELEAVRDERRQLLARLAACEAALGLQPANMVGAVDHPSSGLASGQDRAVDQG